MLTYSVEYGSDDSLRVHFVDKAIYRIRSPAIMSTLRRTLITTHPYTHPYVIEIFFVTHVRALRTTVPHPSQVSFVVTSILSLFLRNTRNGFYVSNRVCSHENTGVYWGLSDCWLMHIFLTSDRKGEIYRFSYSMSQAFSNVRGVKWYDRTPQPCMRKHRNEKSFILVQSLYSWT